MTTTPILVVRSSRLKYILLLVASAGFVAGGAFLVAFEDGANDWVGWMCIVFFGAGIPLFARQLFDSKPRVVLDEEGVFDRTLGVGLIPWSDIETSYVKSIHGNSFVCLVLRDPERWVGKLSGTQQALVRANEKLGFQPLNINLSGTTARPWMSRSCRMSYSRKAASTRKMANKRIESARVACPTRKSEALLLAAHSRRWA